MTITSGKARRMSVPACAMLSSTNSISASFPHPPQQRVIHRVDSAESMPPQTVEPIAQPDGVRLGRLINADAAGIALLMAR